jgi:hypothetical protein
MHQLTIIVMALASDGLMKQHCRSARQSFYKRFVSVTCGNIDINGIQSYGGLKAGKKVVSN